MSTMTIIGLMIWGAMLLLGRVTVGGEEKKLISRVVTIIIALFVVGVVFTVIGLLGLIVLSPVLHFFNLEWFIIPNF